jgi:molybdopterin-binding protein
MKDQDKLLAPREAAQILGISYTTIKQWIYKQKLRTVKTAGGHHRIPESQLDRFLYRESKQVPPSDRRGNFRRISGRNQLVGRVLDIRVNDMFAQVRLSIGGQRITSIITVDAAREMRLKVGTKVAALIKTTDVMLTRT